MPSGVFQLMQAGLLLQHPAPWLNLDRLIRDAINFGCGASPLFMPTSSEFDSATGGKILHYTMECIDRNTLDSLLVTRESPSPPPYNEHNAHTSVPDPVQPLGPRTFERSTHELLRYQTVNQSPMSDFSSPASFMTASSPATFLSARSAYNSPAYLSASGYSPATRIETIREDKPPVPGLSAPIQQLHSDYYVFLREQNLIQPFDAELNWSGKGQHVTFAPQEQIPLTVLSHLGSSNTAIVDKVLCRRIALARKVMRCNRRWTVADALREVYHLQNLRHSHIVQLVGTYVQGRNLAILMYPVADYHLGTFLEDTSDLRDAHTGTHAPRLLFLASTLYCLTSAVDHIHEHVTKHMDIKPQNILVRKISPQSEDWRVYIADFGLSRSFVSQDHSQTDGPTSLTPRYCAPEVYKHELRGRSADIFSLGCVFLETLTVCDSKDLQEFGDYRSSDSGDQSFHANLNKLQEWASGLRITSSTIGTLRTGTSKIIFNYNLTDLLKSMLDLKPSERPTAKQILNYFTSLPYFTVFRSRNCCQSPPEPYTEYTGIPPAILTTESSMSEYLRTLAPKLPDDTHYLTSDTGYLLSKDTAYQETQRH
jgi:serine/threonine protein kinase